MTRELDDNIKRLYVDEHKSVNRTAIELGVSFNTVAKHLGQMGIPFQRRNVSGPEHHSWKGGLKHRPTRRRGIFKPAKDIINKGYVLIHPPNYLTLPHNKRYILRSHAVWEKAHGMTVPQGHEVHHLNGIKDDDRPENLAAIPKGVHTKITAKLYYIRELQQRIRELEQLPRKEVLYDPLVYETY